jgi:hypothetical protein
VSEVVEPEGEAFTRERLTYQAEPGELNEFLHFCLYLSPQPPTNQPLRSLSATNTRDSIRWERASRPGWPATRCTSPELRWHAKASW